MGYTRFISHHLQGTPLFRVQKIIKFISRKYLAPTVVNKKQNKKLSQYYEIWNQSSPCLLSDELEN